MTKRWDIFSDPDVGFHGREKKNTHSHTTTSLDGQKQTQKFVAAKGVKLLVLGGKV